MPKLKTHKALLKRIRITKNKKMIARSKGQIILIVVHPVKKPEIKEGIRMFQNL